MKTIDELSPSKLHPEEQQVVRDAADALFFCEDLGSDAAAEEELANLYGLVDRLVENDRLQPETGERLTADVEACGPYAPVS